MPAETEPDKRLTLAEAAAASNRSEVTLRRWVRTGQFRARKVRGRVVIDPADLATFLQPVPVGGLARPT